jgi:hypothetical protein
LCRECLQSYGGVGEAVEECRDVLKGVSSINAARISSAVRMKESTWVGPVVEISAVELVATEGMVDSRVVAELEAIGWRVVFGSGSRVVIDGETEAFFLPSNFETLVR